MLNLALITGSAFVLSLVAVRVLIGLLTRWGLKQTIREEMSEAHQAKSRTPMMGGIGFFLATVIVTVAAGGLNYPKVKVVLLIGALSFLIGLVDDISKFTGANTKGVGARYKLIIEIVIGAFLGYFMIWQGISPDMIKVPFGDGAWNLGGLFIPFVIFVYVGTINAVNFTDGVDGLLSGCFLSVGAAYIILVYRTSDPALIPLLCAVCGAVAAFLWHNANPAAIFMGDSGSLFLGGLLAAVAVVTRTELFLAVAGLLFVAEVLSVVIQVASFKLTGKRVFRMSPIHHHFELAGWSESQVATRFMIVATAFCIAGLALFI